MKYLPLIFRNLLRNRRRTVLSIISIAISMFIFAALMTLPAVVRQLLRDRVSALRLDCGNKAGFGGFDYTLPLSYAQTIKRIPHVDAVSGVLFTIADYRNPGEMIPVAAMDPDQIAALFPDWGITTGLAARLQRSRSSALVSPMMMQRFRWKVGDNITFHTPSLPKDLDVSIAGVLGGGSPPPTIVIVPFERLNQMQGNLNKAVLFFIRIDRSEYANFVIRAIDERFANSAFETITETEMGMAQQRLQQFRLLFVGVQLIAFIVAVVIGLVAANTAAMSVRERRHELAVMRSIGFTRAMLVGSIVSEGILIGLTAGAIGVSAAYVVMHFAGAYLIFAGRLILQVTPAVAAGSIALAALIGLLSAAIPALTATHRDISAALRATV